MKASELRTAKKAFREAFYSDFEMPEFKKQAGEEYVKFGKNNDFPLEVLDLFNRSPKHNAIICGKVTYIYGKGLRTPVSEQAKAFIKLFSPRLIKKIILDIEVHSGCCIQVSPTVGGGRTFSHVSFHKIRASACGTKFFYKNNWKDRAEVAKPISAFSPSCKETSLIYYKEYRPGVGIYPIPSYAPALNYIKSDAEVSKHTLSLAENGFSATKFVNFFNGEPDDEQKEETENALKKKFSGASGDRVVISFNENKEQKPTVEDLGASDLTKENFTPINELITSNMYAAHQINNAALFGIQTPGKLGNSGGSEIRESYEVFKNTYVNGKQEQIQEIINFCALCCGVTEKFELTDAPPLSVNIPDSLLEKSLTRDEIRDRLGFPKETTPVNSDSVIKAINSLSPLVANKVLESMSENEVRALVGLPASEAGSATPAAALPSAVPAVTEQDGMVNENIKSLNAKQHQQLLRIVRQYKKNVIERPMAVTMLKAGLGLTDEQVTSILGAPLAMSVEMDSEFMEELAGNLFSEYGESKEGYSIISSAKADFTSTQEAVEMFSAAEAISGTQARILSVIKGDGLISDEAIAEALSLPIEVVSSEIKDLVNSGAIASKTGGKRVVIEKAVTIPKSIAKTLPKVEVRYSYEVIPGVGPEVKPTTRPFCKKMCELNRLYTRMDIEKISQKLGYSVWDRRGGFWNKGNGQTSPSCRHYFAMHVVIKKEK